MRGGPRRYLRWVGPVPYWDDPSDEEVLTGSLTKLIFQKPLSLTSKNED